ncbi:hypothetical protein CAI21_02045 [Alkalilimnicola ehrlichii]|uniref:Outer membrane protein beta-barrel domain-containing protein n=1 Tax=Alkalilimnicola ehrlichii TaxID=351052 RepID=A0A3E0X386_9GAMM|nr:hypothetical protein [Alkalilimnicola ehrlichii]RFA31418.1 hypothetical protein CAI21_02045 [Alkalilimnicola ehrlichii]RFA39310.1 hypothetical protein CAL65_00350 [Alkalilimnicola ehrlichii]
MRRVSTITALLGAFSLPSTAFGWGHDIAVSADVRRAATDMAYTTGEVETRTTQAGVTLFEPSISAFQPGIHFGYLWASQSDNEAVSGLDLQGQYFGINLKSRLFERSWLGLHFHASYTYMEAKDDIDEQETRLRWYEAEVAGGPSLNFERVQLDIGAYYRDIDGEEFATGDLTWTRNFEQDNDIGAYAELHYWTDPTGSISLRAEGGAYTAFQASFARRF